MFEGTELKNEFLVKKINFENVHIKFITKFTKEYIGIKNIYKRYIKFIRYTINLYKETRNIKSSFNKRRFISKRFKTLYNRQPSKFSKIKWIKFRSD
jgi:hypothetical protein